MTLTEAMQRVNTLPQEKQKVLSEFIEFLLSSSDVNHVPAEHTRLELDSPFFGMWADRPEMADSADYVRALRQREWEGRHATD